MRLIKTHDGLIGLLFKDKMIWCDNVDEATRIAFAHYQKWELTAEEMRADIDLALNVMAQNGDTVAEFGVFGSFIFSMSEAKYEF